MNVARFVGKKRTGGTSIAKSSCLSFVLWSFCRLINPHQFLVSTWQIFPAKDYNLVRSFIEQFLWNLSTFFFFFYSSWRMRDPSEIIFKISYLSLHYIEFLPLCQIYIEERVKIRNWGKMRWGLRVERINGVISCYNITCYRDIIYLIAFSWQLWIIL